MQGKGGRWRWSIWQSTWDKGSSIRCLEPVRGHESPGGAKRAAYAFLSGVGAPRLEVESIVAYESQESAEK